LCIGRALAAVRRGEATVERVDAGEVDVGAVTRTTIRAARTRVSDARTRTGRTDRLAVAVAARAAVALFAVRRVGDAVAAVVRVTRSIDASRGADRASRQAVGAVLGDGVAVFAGLTDRHVDVAVAAVAGAARNAVAGRVADHAAGLTRRAAFGG